MAKDNRDPLEVLKFELRFLEDGGYGQSPHSPRRRSLIFEDSLSCMNFNTLEERQPCSDCLFMRFVPKENASQEIPCRHIPLNPAGQTLASLYESGSPREIEEALGQWLKEAIQQLEKERAAASASPTGKPAQR